MGRRLINGQPYFIEAGYFDNATTLVAMHIIVAEVRDDLP